MTLQIGQVYRYKAEALKKWINDDESKYFQFKVISVSDWVVLVECTEVRPGEPISPSWMSDFNLEEFSTLELINNHIVSKRVVLC